MVVLSTTLHFDLRLRKLTFILDFTIVRKSESVQISPSQGNNAFLPFHFWAKPSKDTITFTL